MRCCPCFNCVLFFFLLALQSEGESKNKIEIAQKGIAIPMRIEIRNMNAFAPDLRPTKPTTEPTRNPIAANKIIAKPVKPRHKNVV